MWNTLQKTVWPPLIKINIHLLYDPAISPLYIYLAQALRWHGGIICPHKNLYANVDSSFLHNSPKWKESKYLSIEAYINKCDSFPTVDDYSATKKEQRTHACNNMIKKYYIK